MGGIGITPYAAGQFTTFDLPAFAEQALVGSNIFALAYGAKSVTTSRSELGLRSDKSFSMADGIFTLRGRAHDFKSIALPVRRSRCSSAPTPPATPAT